MKRDICGQPATKLTPGWFVSGNPVRVEACEVCVKRSEFRKDEDNENKRISLVEQKVAGRSEES